MSKRKTTKEFVSDAKVIHGSKYNYEITSYINAKTKVNITCPEHGVFTQTPNDHLCGKGCRDCGFENNALKQSLDTESWIKSAMLIHGGKFNYDKVIYVNNRTPVIIKCHYHGEYIQRPTVHTSGNGCTICGILANIKDASRYLYFGFSIEKKLFKIGMTSDPVRRTATLKHGVCKDFLIINYIDLLDKEKAFTAETHLLNYFRDRFGTVLDKFPGYSECIPMEPEDLDLYEKLLYDFIEAGKHLKPLLNKDYKIVRWAI